MDDLVCPRCKTTKYRNPSLKLLVNVCGHALCESCVELLFVKGSGTCPDCSVALRRSGFRVQLFEDPIVEKEVDIRRRILRDYCKRESHFRNLREYNDYLEEVETVVFNLVNNIDVIDTNKRIEQYKRENKEQIAKSKTRPIDEILELDAILEQEKMRSEMLRLESINVEKEEKLRKLKSQESLIDDLMFSDVDAKSIVASHKNMKKNRVENNNDVKITNTILNPPGPTQPVSFTSGIGFSTGRTSFLPVPKMEDVPLFVYEEFHLDFGGINPPTIEELKNTHTTYLSHIKAASDSEMAGGFHSSIACCRALQDAFADITFEPKLLKKTDAAEPMDTC